MRLLVCGSRHWKDAAAIRSYLEQLRNQTEVVIEGEGRGADRLARDAAERLGVPILPFPVDWNSHPEGWCKCDDQSGWCPWAGPYRNRRMLDEGRPTHVLAFADADHFWARKSGTRGTCLMALEAGLPTTLIRHDGGRLVVHKLQLADLQAA